MRFLIAPDSFKGSLTAREVAESIGRGIGSEHDVVLLPLADGGEGTVDALLAAGFSPGSARAQDARGDLHATTFALRGDTAVVELADACGLAALGGDLRPLSSSTRGLGEAFLAARAAGARRIVLALGGSASTDGGTGFLAALGVRFLDARGAELEPSGETVPSIRRVDASGMIDLDGLELVAATDVDSVLTGFTGAAHVFGPQKGLLPHDVERLDAALAALVDACVAGGLLAAPDAAATPGAGAAGGTGFAALLLGATIVSGADFVLDLVGFDGRAADADVVVTGEGSLDAQTASGKLVQVVARRAGRTPVVAVVGRSTVAAREAAALGLAGVTAIAGLTTDDPARDPALSRRLLERVGRDLAATATKG
ncbi:Glycerate 2-kinase [Frondihabitans sp. 762G35]|uniref:glycerate kinase n=1 Tax=Frondihabitans sp. 762G35 TaxID=1446794 RepID=UPI000D213297|nr:glycerate kinase [Frondihabitans sp. 762G35]ARC57974.1 Glycerate 2-kinase [Frondihabitans sp. 762G35]